MAEIQKPLEVVPVESAPIETKPVDETPAPVEVAPIVEDKPAEEVKPVEATEETEAPKEEVKEEVKPVEEGQLGHKAQGLSFPKNLIPTKEFFFFGTDAVEPKALASYQKSEKSTETAQSNIAWASETGKGLLFVGDKKTPSSIISLADATEPDVEGTHKFTLTSKGNKHTFKAATAAERDNWVSQLKLKIAEAKELSATVTESETYKATIESFKPAPPAKKEEAVVAPVVPVEEAAKPEETPVATEAPKEEEVKETKVEEPKRRSASRKRASFFGFGKKEEKKEEAKVEEPKTEEETAVEAAPAPGVEATPVVPAVETEAPVTETAPATEATPVVEEPVESPKEKTPGASKRNSFFGGVFSKKEKKAGETKPVEATETPVETETAPTEETAPVIPPVETTTPLAVDVSSPATVPTETTEVSPATNGEPKKDIKEKRKSSLPFAFGKREKSPAPVEGESPKQASAFSKLRATIKGKSAPKAEDKTAEEAVKEDEAKVEETPAVPATETAKVEEPAVVEPEVENKPENVATTTPAVTAAA